MTYRILLFDFDETLVCSKPTYHAAYQHAVAVHPIDGSADALFHDLWHQVITPKQVLSQLGAERAYALLEAFELHYYNNHHNSLSTYPAIIEMLTELRAAGKKLGIVSLKPRRAGEKELDICGLRCYFEVAIWGDDVAQPKPAPDGCIKALEVLGGDAGEALVCGDSASDIRMGQAAGIRTAAALWGEANRELLLATKPDFRFEHPLELLRIS